MKNKLFIIIIVLLIAILLFLSIFFSEKEEKFITEITYQQLVSKMDKKELEAGIAKANQVLQNTNKNDFLSQINNNKK